MTDDTRLTALRQLQQLDAEDGDQKYARCLVWIWKAADTAKLTIRRAQ